jgi:hypothetical protein
MREIAEIELAIQGGTEKIEQLGEFIMSFHGVRSKPTFLQANLERLKNPCARWPQLKR